MHRDADVPYRRGVRCGRGGSSHVWYGSASRRCRRRAPHRRRIASRPDRPGLGPQLASYREALSTGLAAEGFEVVVAADAAEALELRGALEPRLLALSAPRLTADDFGGPALEGCNEILNVSRPDIITATRADDGTIDLDTWKAIQIAMIGHAEKSGDRLAILDTPPNLGPSAAAAWRRRRSSAVSGVDRLAMKASVRFRRSSGFQNSGSQPADRNSSGGLRRARSTHALIPRVNATATRRVSGP